MPSQLDRLKSSFGDHLTAQAETAVTHLMSLLSGRAAGAAKVLVAYGGGKDSSFTLAFIALVRLLLLERLGWTFQLRVVTNRHAGMPAAVMENIDRAYQALGLYEHAELLVIDGDEVRPFRVDLPLPRHVVNRNRTDILMNGHRAEGDPRPTFCIACNFSMLAGFVHGALWGGGVDVIVTGDSPAELAAYRGWLENAGAALDIQLGQEHPIHAVRQLNDRYYADLHGQDGVDQIAGRRIPQADVRPISFFSIFEFTRYEAGAHWQVLELLGFEFDDATFSFSFTESDCSNPTLMCHLRGLKQERLYDRSYNNGIDDYLQFVIPLMAKKSFPPHLVERMQARYATPGGRAEMRRRAAQDARDRFGLDEHHLVAMLYSPFVDGGRNLARYLRREQPRLLPELERIHCVLAGRSGSVADEPALARLSTLTGLSLDQMRHLYRRPLLSPTVHPLNSSATATSNDEASPLKVILAGDPHRGEVITRHAPDGPELVEVLSGR